jgi:hypothetical protein
MADMPQTILWMAAAASKANPHKTHQKRHASRAPICLNLKENRGVTQVAGGGRFDLREPPNYLKVEMIG